MSDRIPQMRAHRWRSLVSPVVFIVAVLYSIAVQCMMRPYAYGGVYFHPWSSEDMMQTVSLRDLRRNPLQTLAHIHIQPPAFDAIRAALAQFWPDLSDADALIRVDSSIYFLWALVLGLIVALAYRWLAAQCGTIPALVGSLLILMHPASIFFATYLDSTVLSAFLVLGTYYLLWKLKNGQQVHILWFSLVTLALFFTRSIFQLPAFVLFAASLHLIGVPKRQLVTYSVVVGIISGLYVAKQHQQFSLPSTSSFTGVNLANSIDVGMGSARYAAYLDDPAHPSMMTPSMPDVLIKKTKIAGQPNFNHIDYLYLNNQLLARYVKDVRSMSLANLAEEYLENATIYFKPSSTYSSHHVIVDRLPWTGPYNRLFSAPVLLYLILLGFVVWLVRTIRNHSLKKGLGILLPGLYVLIVSIVSDKGENMRFKFFLEQVMLIFLVSQFSVLARATIRAWGRQRTLP
jgi:hypothetical protein